jgi:SWI/SNF-related matrix-associated actin-dependent regulator of chromatin subfamily A3
MMVLSRKLNNCALAPIQGHTQMVVTKIESQHVIAFSDGVVAGEVNAQLEKALCGIAEQGHELEFEVFAPVKAMLETIGRATKGKDAIIRVQINLYGPRNAASDIGKELSLHKLYLQDPGYIRDEIIYDNPHILKLPGFDCLNAEVFPPQEGSACHKAPPEALETAMKDVYSSLTRDHNLQALEGDKRLQTCLLP